MTDTRPNEPRGVRIPDSLLWAGAVVLCALILVNGARVNDTPAFAEMAVKSGGYSMITTEAGTSEALAIVDDRSERLLVYTVEPGGGLQLRVSQSLPEMFLDARRQGGP